MRVFSLFERLDITYIHSWLICEELTGAYVTTQKTGKMIARLSHACVLMCSHEKVGRSCVL